jgi:hypothetical protein
MDPATVACLKLLRDVNCSKYRDHPYCKPFIEYVMQWPHHLPVKTVIIGQNPYPGDIFPEIGSALAYDESKISYPPGSVRVLAEDLYHHDKTPRQLTIDCFRDSWRMLEHGVIMINETVFHKISKDIDLPNTGVLKEMESQVLALQTLLAVGFTMGQTSVTFIGMGIGASMMTSIIRPWCPSDLISTRVMTCSNPAAFASMLRDSSSQKITLGKSHISKVLSTIVALYATMPPKTSTAEKRRQQGIETLNKAVAEVKESSNVDDGELRSFKDRLTRMDPSNPTQGDIKDLAKSIDALMKTKDRYNNAISVHHISMLALMEIAFKEHPKIDGRPGASGPSTDSVVPQPSASAAATSSPTPRRRVVRRTVSESPQVPTISEDVPAAPDVPNTPVPIDNTDVVSVQSLSRPVTRSRRRVSRQSAPSIADSEYTVVSNADETRTPGNYDMDQGQAVHVRTFAQWLKDNRKDDPSFQVILSSAADSRTTDNELSRAVLSYIKSRKDGDARYDSYDELSDPDSLSSKWIADYMKNH